jgi:hypothetical protein
MRKKSIKVWHWISRNIPICNSWRSWPPHQDVRFSDVAPPPPLSRGNCWPYRGKYWKFVEIKLPTLKGPPSKSVGGENGGKIPCNAYTIHAFICCKCVVYWEEGLWCALIKCTWARGNPRRVGNLEGRVRGSNGRQGESVYEQPGTEVDNSYHIWRVPSK